MESIIAVCTNFASSILLISFICFLGVLGVTCAVKAVYACRPDSGHIAALTKGQRSSPVKGNESRKTACGSNTFANLARSRLDQSTYLDKNLNLTAEHAQPKHQEQSRHVCMLWRTGTVSMASSEQIPTSLLRTMMDYLTVLLASREGTCMPRCIMACTQSSEAACQYTCMSA